MTMNPCYDDFHQMTAIAKNKLIQQEETDMIRSRQILRSTVLTLMFCLLCSCACALEHMELNGSSFFPGDTLDVYCSGVTAEESAGQCWIATAVPGTPAGSYLEWTYLPYGSSHAFLQLPGTPGSYEVRFYKANAATDENLVREKTVPFTISYGKSAGSITLDRTAYLPGQYMQVSYSGISASATQREAWIAVARSGAPASSYMDWKYVTPDSGSLWLDVPAEPGSYEVRFFPASQATEANLADGLRIPFSVTGSRPSDSTVQYPTRNDFDWDLLEYLPGYRSWTGTYATNYKTLSLIQSGSSVTGNYPEWDSGRLDGTIENGMLWGYWYEAPTYLPPNDAGQIVFALYPDGQGFQGWWRYGNNGAWQVWSAGELNLQAASRWASEAIYTADAHGLIPRCLQGSDLTQNITFAEFSALSVRLFEEIWQTQEIPVPAPYAGVQGHSLEIEINKAYGLGFLMPVQADLFGPDRAFSREIMAAMYCNVIRACEFDGCTLNNIGSFFLPYAVFGHFDDDSSISASCRDSIGFMSFAGLMDPVSGNRFEPQSMATREQAIVTALRILLRERAIMDGQLLPAGQALSSYRKN